MYRYDLRIMRSVPLLSIAVITLGLAAGLFARAPETAALANNGNGDWSDCGGVQYWEYFFAHTPDVPQVVQSSCPLAGDEAVRQDPGASLYWEYFFAQNADNAREIPFADPLIVKQVAQP